MGMLNTTTNLTYARNDLIKQGRSHIFDKVGDMIYYFVKNNDVATGFSELVTSTSDNGFATTATFVPDASRLDYAYSMGNRATELTVNLAAAASQNLELFQANVNLTSTAGEPTSASTVCLMRLRYTHDTTDMTYLRLRAINSYTLIKKEIQDAYGCIHGIDFYTNSVTVNGEAAVGVFNMECNSTVTGTVRGMIINVYGNGVPSTTSVGLEVRIDGSSAGTLTEGIRIRAVGGNTITTGLRIYGAAADKIGTGIDVAVTAAASGKYGIYVHNTYTKNDGGVHKAISSAVTWTPTAAGYSTPIAVVGKVTVDGTFQTTAGYGWGVQGQIDFSDNAVLNQNSSIFAGGRFAITASATPTFTEAGFVTCIYCDNLCTYDLNGMSTGKSTFISLWNSGGEMDAAFNVFGGNQIPVLFRFDACGGTDQAHMVELGTAKTGVSANIAIDWEGTTYWINMKAA